MIVDAHVHVFLSASDDPERTVDVLAPPGREASLEALERQMATAGVDCGAVLIPLGPEDRYVSTCVASDPARFAGIVVSASDEEDPGRVAERLDVGRFSGLRMFGLPGDLIDRPTWLGVLERLAAAGKVLWLYPQPEHLPAADAVAARLPDLRIVLNHTGFTQAGIGLDEYGRPRIDSPVPQPQEAQVLALSRHPTLSVTLSGAYGFSISSTRIRTWPRWFVAWPTLLASSASPGLATFRGSWSAPAIAPASTWLTTTSRGLRAERSALLGDNIRRILQWVAR